MNITPVMAANVLRARGCKWADCVEWLAQHGIHTTLHALAMAHLRWLRTSPQLPAADLDIEAAFKRVHHPSLADLL